jgi:hypothetical protein
MFGKVAQPRLSSDPAMVERFADLLFELGKDQLEKGQAELAVRWLERAHDILAELEIERLGTDAGELRLSIAHHLVRALLVQRNEDARSRAWQFISLIENDFGERFVVSVLKLELLSTDTHTDPEAYLNVLSRVTRTAILTEKCFKTILHHIHKLKELNAAFACNCLDDLIEIRLYEDGMQEFLEKAVILRIWITISNEEDQTAPISTKTFLEHVAHKFVAPLTAPAAHAVLLLIWKKIEATYSQAEYQLAQQWCAMIQHQILAQSGELNAVIISRKLIQCAIARHDDAAVREAFYQMPSASRDAPATRYLIYRFALRTNDTELAAESLELVSKASKQDTSLLHACVLEAQQSGNRQQAIAALQKVVVKFNHQASTPVNLPALLRCTARLISAELTHSQAGSDTLLSEFCSIFESAGAQAKSLASSNSPQEDKMFTQQEIEWFSKTAYNFALKNITEILPEYLLRLLRAAIGLVELLRTLEVDDNQHEVLNRLLLCHFLASCASLTLARAEDNIELSLQHYCEVERHASRFHELWTILSGESDDFAGSAAMHAKRFELFRFQLEGAVRRQSWNELEDLLDQCLTYDRFQHLEKLADLVLSIHGTVLKSEAGSQTQRKVLAVVQKIINSSWKASGYDIVKLSRWLRCLFAIALPSDAQVSLLCLDQARQIVRQEIDHAVTGERYPAEEIEWLATSAFNRAVDLYCASDDDGCRLWAENALSVAGVSKDTEGLHKLLVERYSGLRWDVEG